MLSERDVELAHPEAFDFVWGNLPAAKRAAFNRHLAGCRYCQGVVDEYSEIGQIIKHLPPHVEPPPDLEDRTVAAMVAALARPEGPDRSPLGPRRSGCHLDLPDSRGPASGRGRHPGPAETAAPASGRDDTRVQPRPHSSLRPSRGPGRWSLSLLGGDVIEAVSLLSLPPPLPSSLPPSSFRSALAGDRSPQPRSQS